jgi:hypothetical protein
MTITCFSGSVIINWIGLRYTLAFGTTGYVFYSAALYVTSRMREEKASSSKQIPE